MFADSAGEKVPNSVFALVYLTSTGVVIQCSLLLPNGHDSDYYMFFQKTYNYGQR